MDGTLWDARPLWGRVHSRGGTIWEQNVKAGPRMEIYAPTSGSNGCVWHCVDEVAVTAFLPSSPKEVHPFLSVGTSGGWRGSNNSRVKFFQPSRLSFFFFSHWLSLKRVSTWSGAGSKRSRMSNFMVPALSLCVCPVQQRQADVDWWSTVQKKKKNTAETKGTSTSCIN